MSDEVEDPRWQPRARDRSNTAEIEFEEKFQSNMCVMKEADDERRARAIDARRSRSVTRNADADHEQAVIEAALSGRRGKRAARCG